MRYDDSAFPGLIAVAKGGYQMAGTLAVAVAGEYSVTATGGMAGINPYGSLHTGSFAEGAFNADPTWAPYYFISDSGFSNGTAHSGALGGSTLIGDQALTSAALGVDVIMTTTAYQFGPGLTNSTVNNISYGFAVTPVPEPETYAMLLAGLGLVGAIARRRKANA